MTPRDDDRGLDEDSRQEAVEVLRNCAQWRLSPAWWGRIDTILDGADTALRTRNMNAFTAAIDELALASPFRVSRISKPDSGQPASPARQERLNRMVYEVGALPSRPQNTTDDQNTDDERDSRE